MLPARHFSKKPLAVALTLLVGSVAPTAYSAGLDRSGQDITPFLQDGTYAEVTYTYIDADVEGVDNKHYASTDFEADRKFGDIAESYDFFRYAVKTDINDRVSVGVLFDDPFGAAVQYSGDNDFGGGAPDALNDTIDKVLAKGINTSEARQNTLKKNIENIPKPIPILQDPTVSGLLKSVQGSVRKTQDAMKAIQAISDPTQKLNAFNQLVDSSRQNLANLKQTYANVIEPKLKSDPNLKGVKDMADKIIEDNEKAIESLQVAKSVAESLNNNVAGTSAEVRTRNISLVGGVKFGEKKNFQVYGGAVAQNLEAEVHLRGDAYSSASGYDAYLGNDQAYGWLAGASYSLPQYGMRAALTYRSKIKHTFDIAENLPASDLIYLEGRARPSREMSVELPESVNLNLQTGLNPTTLASLNVRWVPWSKFDITPPLYTDVTRGRNGTDKYNETEGLPLVSYEKDQWSAELALAKRLSPKLAVSGSIGYDTGAGDRVTSLGPIKGYKSVGLGAKYNFTDQWSVSAGARYMKFGDATGVVPTGNSVSQTSDNDGMVYGIKLAYQSK